jgi:hypothetical protein
MNLREEIGRCAPFFEPIGTQASKVVADPVLTALLERTNATLALSGALVLFGLGHDPAHPLDLRCYRAWGGRGEYGLLPDDEIFGADIFGDLLFVRRGDAFRLDGEGGELDPLGPIAAWIEKERRDVAGEVGGNLAGERFAGRVFGEDPLRLLPVRPFMTNEFIEGQFFETPLSNALAIKRRCYRLCRDAPEGAKVDFSFWHG